MPSFHFLQEANAMLPGSDLWILPDLEQSAWTRKIDWYCNFQFLKATRRHPPRMSADLIQLLVETDCDRFEINVHRHAPLMVGTSFFLPNRQTVLVPFEENPASWVIKSHYLWQRLRNPSLRIFLPQAIAPEFCQSQWPLKNDENVISVVAGR